jgi:hypothetical protein
MTVGVLLIVLGVIANNLVYLQDLWLGQQHISWTAGAYGLLVSIAVILAGTTSGAPRTLIDRIGRAPTLAQGERVRPAGDGSIRPHLICYAGRRSVGCAAAWRRPDTPGRRRAPAEGAGAE